MGVVVNTHIGTLHLAIRPSAEAMTAAARAADAVFRGFEKELFASEGASGGEPWLPLSDRYRRWKEGARSRDRAENKKRIAKYRAGGGHLTQVIARSTRILVLTGQMREDFTTEGAHHVARGSQTATGGKIELGAEGEEFYAMHATGRPPDSGRGGRPPKRDPMQSTPEQKNEMLNAARMALVPYLEAQLRAMISEGRLPGGSGA